MRRALLILGGLSVLGVGIFSGETPARSRPQGGVQAEILAAEYGLAKEPNFYFVLDLQAETMTLKVKGMVMRQWALKRTKFWGQPDFPATIEIAAKSALKAPERFEIRPAPEEESPESDPGKFELKALEITDMPGGFTLHSREGIRISVKSRSGLIGRGPGSLISSAIWHTVVPLRHLAQAILGKPKFSIELEFRDMIEAQSIYWTFFEGIKGIIY